MLKYACRKIDFFITVSNNTKNDLIKFLNIPSQKIKTIYLAPVISPQITPEPVKEIHPPFIATHHFGLPLLSIFSQIKKDGFPHQLVIFGSLPKKVQKKVLQKAKELGIENNVILTGYLNNAQIAWIYQNADLFIRYVGYEGFGIPILEAIQFGCPVIATKVASLPEIAGKAGVFVELNNQSEWVEQIEKTLSDTNFRQKLIKEGKIRASQFSWLKTAEETIQVYQKILNK